MSNQEKINEFRLNITDLVEKFGGALPPYEIVHCLICAGVTMSLMCAPNEMLGMKTVMACIENGIAEYEETAS